MATMRRLLRFSLTASLGTFSIQCVSQATAFSASSVSLFHGNSLSLESPKLRTQHSSGIASLSMRKQKASDRRTRRMQRGRDTAVSENPIGRIETLTNSPMAVAEWKHKQVVSPQRRERSGRGRARKRSTLYNSLSSYHNNFLHLLQQEYQKEEEEILGRIKASVDDPLGLEATGEALFDLIAQRRGNLFADEVYRLAKSEDASTTFSTAGSDNEPSLSRINSNHKFTSNDVVLLTLQPGGIGDFFGQTSLPTSPLAVSVEARVLNTGPNYVDVALPGGAFEAAFGPAPNNASPSGRGDSRMRLRADRFFSNIPYTRMVTALSQLTSIPERKITSNSDLAADKSDSSLHGWIQMDELLRKTILSTYALNDPSSPMFRDTDACDLRELEKKLAKPPLSNSATLAKQVMLHIQSNPYGTFSTFNGPQLTAIEAALTRRLTLIQGPPGTGKTTVGSTIAFGFVHQCRNISPNTKVLACAFSNVGADNLAEQLVRLGLKVVRIGKPSAVSEPLWDYTLEAAIDKDPQAQKSLRNAAWATSQLTKSSTQRKGGSRSRSSILSERSKRDIATAAVKASIKACNVAATKALREADVIVSTSTGASDPRLLAACGIGADDDDEPFEKHGSFKSSSRARLPKPGDRRQNCGGAIYRADAPDGLPPLSMPFVIIDEACQSVEPATLIPITSTNSCRSLVLLGDPCQLPPTVKWSASSPLSISLMERLAASLPQPVIVPGQTDQTEKDDSFLRSKPTKQAMSTLQSLETGRHTSYRKQFAGSLLLSVQYRMHSSIAAFSSAIFYDGLLSTPSFLVSQRPFPEALCKALEIDDCSVGVRLVDVGGRANERRGVPNKFSNTAFTTSTSASSESIDQTSYWNKDEAYQVLSIIKQFMSGLKHDYVEETPSIGVVTPYNLQAELIKSLFLADEELNTKPSLIDVKTVDGYQGRERDVIVFSAVRSNRQGKVGFLKDWRRMNVALTRARRALVVVGDIETLSEGDKHWAAFVEWCKGMHCVLSCDK